MEIAPFSSNREKRCLPVKITLNVGGMWEPLTLLAIVKRSVFLVGKWMMLGIRSPEY